jgi:hypothetical protein
MRTITTMIIAVFLLTGGAYGHSRIGNDNAPVATSSQTARDATLTVIAQATPEKPKRKIQLRRICTPEQIKCSCADTGTSACCKPSQNCNCQPTANCRG